MRPVRSRRSLVLSAILTGLLLSLLTQSAGAARGTTIKAVVVKSWSGCGSGGVIWDDLNANWSQYGSVPISIDYSNTQLCSGPVTYDALVASGADVVIISDAAGGGQQYSQSEIDAVRQYADAGHNVIATYVTFFFGTDNRGLAPIFGIRKATTYLANEQAVTPNYDLRWPTSPLFRDVPDPYQSSGYPFSQVPSDGAWSNNEVHVGDLTGRTSDSRAIVLVHTVMDSARIYISNMPEYGGGTQDKQFFYNAIIYPSAG
jgi:hypothetical protein